MKLGKRGCIALLATLLVVPAFAQEPKPVNRPEELGFSADRLERVTKTFQGYVDNGQLPGAVVLIARNDKVAVLQGLRLPRPGAEGGDDNRLDFPPRLDDQAHRQRRRDDPGGGRQTRSRRAGVAVFAGVQGPPGPDRAPGPRHRQDGAGVGTANPADDRAGSAAPHRRPRVPATDRRWAGPRPLSRRERRGSEHDAGGDGDEAVQIAAGASTRRGLGIQHGRRRSSAVSSKWHPGWTSTVSSRNA